MNSSDFRFIFTEFTQDNNADFCTKQYSFWTSLESWRETIPQIIKKRLKVKTYKQYWYFYSYTTRCLDFIRLTQCIRNIYLWIKDISRTTTFLHHIVAHAQSKFVKSFLIGFDHKKMVIKKRGGGQMYSHIQLWYDSSESTLTPFFGSIYSDIFTLRHCLVYLLMV